MVRKHVWVSRRCVRMALGFVVACLVTVLALAGCQDAVPPPPPPSVSFTTQEPMIEIPTLVEGVAMSSVTLPAAIGGSSELTYSLNPEVPGLTFTASTRVLSGTPTAAGSYSMTYTAADTGEATASLSFTITVQAAPPPLTIDPAPTAAAVANGTYLSAVLAGDANDALTVDGGAALAEDVLTDEQVAALLAADWWKTPAELALAIPAAYAALLAALVPVYDKHLPPAMHTVTLRETVMPQRDDRFFPPIDLTTLALGAAHVGALASQPPVEQTESCYLSVEEATAGLVSGDPAVAQRVGVCVTFPAATLTTMQAVEVARTCASGGCSGEAGRKVLAAIGATSLYGMIDGMADQLTDMVIAEWLLGWYVGFGVHDDDDDGIGELREYVLMRILEDGAGFTGFYRDNEDRELEVAVDAELGPWVHRRTSSGGEFVSDGGRLHYQYIGSYLNGLHGGTPGEDWWMHRIGDELVGTWSGANDDHTYTLEIDERGAVVVTVSGDERSGWINHEQHYREDERDNTVFDDQGFPVLNGCGDLRIVFPRAEEAQLWHYCIDDDGTAMETWVPPYADIDDWGDPEVILIRQ